MYHPLFIVIEGLDGSGKTTQLEMLRDHLQSQGQSCFLTGEPTDLPTGRLIRSVLRKELEMHPKALAALYAADRIEHLHHAEQGILAKLSEGHHVLASRYYFSSMAYQSEYASPGWIAALNSHAKQTLPADLTIFLDLDPEVSLERIAKRGEAVELFDTREKLTHVRESFRAALEHMGQGENIQIVDASADPVTIADRIAALVDKELAR